MIIEILHSLQMVFWPYPELVNTFGWEPAEAWVYCITMDVVYIVLGFWFFISRSFKKGE
jgi:hypothetical protein